MMFGVILYGPPASGKDTVNAALTKLDARYMQYSRLKAGVGRGTGYTMVTPDEIEALRAAGEVIWENRRYGAVYVVDRQSLNAMLQRFVPVIHLGQVGAVEVVINAFPHVRWTAVSLWCPRDVAQTRIAQRATGDAAARLQAWDETEPLGMADLTINTAETDPKEAAAVIHCHVVSPAI